MTPFLRTVIVSFFLGLVVSGTAFTSPLQQKSATTLAPKTVMHFKFLKELGLEKPSWLPDFGGKKEEEAAPAPEAAAEEDATEGEEVAAESEE